MPVDTVEDGPGPEAVAIMMMTGPLVLPGPTRIPILSWLQSQCRLGSWSGRVLEMSWVHATICNCLRASETYQSSSPADSGNSECAAEQKRKNPRLLISTWKPGPAHRIDCIVEDDPAALDGCDLLDSLLHADNADEPADAAHAQVSPCEVTPSLPVSLSPTVRVQVRVSPSPSQSRRGNSESESVRVTYTARGCCAFPGG